MIKLNEIEINKFRGISDLLLANVGEVNLIVGDNNCGKTSILEAIQLLRDPTNVNNALRVARIRDSYMGFSRLPIFDNFVNMCAVSPCLTPSGYLAISTFKRYPIFSLPRLNTSS